MAFWKNLWTGVKVAVAIGAVVNGSKFGDKRINVKELPDVLDIINKVETVVNAVKTAQNEQKADNGGSV